MTYLKIISVIDNNNIKVLSETFREEVKNSGYLKTYQQLSDEELLKKGYDVFNNLIKWISSGSQEKEIENYFTAIGAERLREGFPLGEINYALFLSKKIFWDFVISCENLIWEFETTEVIEFMHHLNIYFDMGNFFIIRGYLNELLKYLDETKKFSKEELESYLIKGALYKETIKTIQEKLFRRGLGYDN